MQDVPFGSAPLESRPDPRSLTFTAIMAERARTLGDKVFLKYLPDGRCYSYAQVDTLSNRIAHNVLKAGVGPGSHVGVMMENCPEQMLAYFGLAKAGAVSVPVNTAARGDLLAYFLSHADCCALIVDEHLLPRVFEVCDRLELLTRIFILRTTDAALLSDTDESRRVDIHDFAVLLARGNDRPPPAPKYSDLAFLMYTSGTTGPSKAIMFTQAHTLYWGWDYGWHHQYDESDVAYVYLPLFHGNAWLCATLGAFMSGATVALARRFSASRFWQEVAASGATVTNCLGAVASFLWAQESAPQERAHRLARMGVTPVPEFGHQLEERFGVRVMSSYGLTDYCSVAAYTAADPREKLGSSGRARLGIDIRIVDEDDLELPSGVAGEIVFRSNNPWGSSIGYYKMPEATLSSRRNLWFHTGDRGYLDSDGYLYFKDRIKDAIRRRGENISAFEVERAIASHWAIASVAAYAVRSASTEDEVAVSAVLRPGTALTPEDLIEHCKENLAYFMIPRYVEFVESLPLNLSLKVEKYILKTRAESRLGELWDREKTDIQLER